MKLNDATWGALLLLFSAVILVHVQGFPKIPGQQVGPALFPGLLAVGLGTCGVLLILKGLAARRSGEGHFEWVAFADWTRSRHYLPAFLLTVGVNIFYILAVNALGFIPTGIVYLGVLFWIYGVGTRWIVPVAVIMTLLIHYSFYKLLKVPLPWGLLQGVAW